jgi:hypothetical protein
LCSRCHGRHNSRACQTHCKRGHEFTPENTVIGSKGLRDCRACRRLRDKGRHDAAYWRAWRAKKGSAATC